jgi:hypothetical protein
MAKITFMKLVIGIVVLFILSFGIVSAYRATQGSGKATPDVEIIVQDYGSSQPENAVPAEAPMVTPAPPVMPPVPAPQPTRLQDYRSERFGLRLTVPARWRAEEWDNRIIFFDGNNEIGSMEIYRNVNESMATIEQQLRNSPDTQNVRSTTVGSTPVVEYFTNSGWHLALTVNGTMYYIHGALVADEVSRTISMVEKK